MTNPPSVIPGSAMFAIEGSSSIADAAGNLLFYTNGMFVYNQANFFMANGSGLFGGNTPVQPCVILKQPGSATLYYIFTVDGNGFAQGHNYSIVDMSLAAGMGSVTVLNSPLYNNTCVERITATRQCNGVDFWVLGRDRTLPVNNFRAYSLTSAGANPVPVISSIGSLGSNGIGGSMKLSPNGRKLLEVSSPGSVFLYDFDNSTGVVSNQIVLATSNNYLGCDFSPDGTKVYAGMTMNNSIHQWDLCAGPAVAASLYTLPAIFPTQMQRAPNGKIYAAQGGMNPGTMLTAIDNPNVAGAGCTVNNMGLSISPGSTGQGLPNLTDYALQMAVLPPFTYTADIVYGCYTASFTAPSELQPYPVGGCLTGSGLVKSMAWNFGDPASGSANTSTLTNPSHTYPAMGTYTAMLLVDYGCGLGIDTLFQQVNINMPCVTVSSTSITCANLGSATVSTTGGTGPYAYTWTPTGQTGSVATGLSPGTYTITLLDIGAGATYTMSTTFVPLVPLTGTLAGSYTMNCPNTGSATVQLSGGSGNQSYLWTNGLVSYTAAAPNTLGPGAWSLTVTDLLTGCQVTKTLSLTSFYPAPQLAASGSSVCIGQNINLNAVTNATALVWAGPQAYSSVQLSPLIANAVPFMSGNYTVTATSALGCMRDTAVNVNVLPPPSLTVSMSSNSLCAQSLNGSPSTITLTSGGAATYTLITPLYIHNSNPNGPVSAITSMPPFQAGVATATLLGFNGACTATTTASFTIVPNPTVSVISSTPVICAGQSHTYTSQGAASYTWGPGSPGLSTYTAPVTVANPTATAVYSVMGGSLGCNSGTETVTLTVMPLPVFTLLPDHPVVCKGSSVNLVVGGTAGSYSWQPPGGLSSTTGPLVIASPAASQIYLVTGSLNGCTTTAAVSVSVAPLPNPLISVSKTAVCLNDSSTFSALGGVQYVWTGPNGFHAQGQTLALLALNVNFAGIYTLTATDNNGCSNTASTQLLVHELPTGSLSGLRQGCVPFCSAFSFSGSPAVSATWHYHYQQVSGNEFSCCFDQPGTHSVTGRFYDALTTCSQTVDYMVTAYPKPEAGFSFVPEAPVEGLDEVTFINESEGGQQSDWAWHFINNAGKTVLAPDARYVFEKEGNYPVAMVVKNTWGCADSIVKVISVKPDFSMYVPNAFTPNDDGHNALFLPVAHGINHYSLSVYNRWGQCVYQASGEAPAWDGTFKGMPCREDVYVWKISATARNGETRQMNGHVTLYR